MLNLEVIIYDTHIYGPTKDIPCVKLVTEFGTNQLINIYGLQAMRISSLLIDMTDGDPVVLHDFEFNPALEWRMDVLMFLQNFEETQSDSKSFKSFGIVANSPIDCPIRFPQDTQFQTKMSQDHSLLHLTEPFVYEPWYEHAGKFVEITISK